MTITARRKRIPGLPNPPIDYEGGFHASYADIIRELSLLGADQPQIAEAIGISVETLKKWRDQHPEVESAVLEGRLIADGKVAASLYRRATGFTQEEIDVRAVDGEVVLTRYERAYPPDVTACIFWLKCRQRALWRDKVEIGVTDRNGNDVKQINPVEAARRIAFLLTNGAMQEESKDG